MNPGSLKYKKQSIMFYAYTLHPTVSLGHTVKGRRHKFLNTHLRPLKIKLFSI